MIPHVALLRGINVGGHGKLPMAALRALLAELGLAGVQTYIQSGNAAFAAPAGTDTAELAGRIAAAVAKGHGFTPAVLVWTAAELAAAMAANPFPEATADPKRLHLFCMAAPPPAPDLDGMAAKAAAGERFAVKGRALYLHAPAGLGRSKLAAGAEQLLGVPATARWRTVAALAELAKK